jgi:N-acetylmuramic acid 6-phosphate etherase
VNTIDALSALPLDVRTTEAPNPAAAGIDVATTGEILLVMNAEDLTVPLAVGRAMPEIGRAVDAIVAAWERGGRLLYFGAGTSGRLGVLDASECPPTFGVPPTMVVGTIAGGDLALRNSVESAEDDADQGAHDVAHQDVEGADVVVGIAASGATPYVIGAVREARARGAVTVGICCNSGAPLSREVHIAIEVVVGPEVVAGSSRLKAGTAQKLVLNMLTTASMVRSGKTYGNLMVDVQPTNTKLRARALRLVSLVGAVDSATASRLLEASAGRVKPAIVMARLGLDVVGADARLRAAGGVLRRALSDLAC